MRFSLDSDVVIPGLVPGIQPSAGARASGEMDPGDKHRDDTVEFAAPASSRLCLQLETLDLAGLGLGQGGDELDGARVLVGGDGRLHVVLQALDAGLVA